jgi:hypothetical protein
MSNIDEYRTIFFLGAALHMFLQPFINKEGEMLKKCLICYLVIALFLMGIAPRLDAGFVPSETLNLSPGTRVVDIDKIRIVLENKLVSQRLRDLGFTPEEATARMSAMSDDQIHSLAQKLDQAKVGGEVGVVIAVLVIVVLVLLIVRLAGGRHGGRW